MSSRLGCPIACLFGLGLCCELFATAKAGDPRHLVDQYLQKQGATGYTITPITEDFVANMFPDIAFFGVYFRQYPVPIYPP